MPTMKKSYDLLISCPGDVDEEIHVIKNVIDRFNRILGEKHGIQILAKHWSTDGYPESGGKPQELLNKQFINDCDAAVAVFWTRFGTPTDRYQSGTQEEIEEMIKSGKKVFLYFSKRPVDPDKLDSKQYEKVKAFKNGYSDRGIYWVYSDINDFDDQVYDHISQYFLKLHGVTEESVLKVQRYLTKKLPERNVYFLGRETEMEALDKKFKEKDGTVLVRGMGGIGKTELLKKYFYTREKGYDQIAWINLEGYGSIPEAFAAQFEIEGLKIVEGSKTKEQYRQIIDYLRNKISSKILLLIDNIEDVKDIALGDINSLPSNINTAVTSRMKITGFQEYVLDFLGIESCKELFYTYYKIEQNDYADIIIEKAGRLTLAVELLAKTAQKKREALERFNNRLDTIGFDLDLSEEVDTMWHGEARKKFYDHMKKVFEITGLEGEEEYVLTNLSVLPAIPIEITVFAHWIKLDRNDSIDSLVEKGWLSFADKEEKSIFMHQIIQEVARDKFKPSIESCGNLIEALSKEISGKDPYSKPEYFMHADSIAVHVRGNSKILGNMLKTIGIILNHKGQYGNGLVRFNGAREIYEKELGINHQYTASIYNNIGITYDCQGKYKEALGWFMKALGIQEKILGNEHSDIAKTCSNIANVYNSLGKYEESLKWHWKAMGIKEKVMENEHPSTAATYNNLANVYRSLGNYEEALKWYTKALSIKEKVMGNEHPSTAATYDNIAIVYSSQGKHEEAFVWHMKALGTREKVLGKEHPDTAITYNNIATVYNSQGKYQEAVGWCLKALKVMTTTLGIDHPETQTVLKNIKDCFLAAGKSEDQFVRWLKETGIV